MKTLTLQESQIISGGVGGPDVISFLAEIAAMGSVGILSAAYSVAHFGEVVLPYVGQLSPNALATVGFIAGAATIYGLTHRAGGGSYSTPYTTYF